MIKKLTSSLLVFSVLTAGLCTNLYVHANENINANNNLPNSSQFDNTALYSEQEFKDLLLASLENDANGQLLLSVTDSIDVKLLPTHVEFATVINLDKVEKISPEARASVEKFNAFFLFLDKNKLNLKVIGEPVVRNGLVGIRDNFSIELGVIPLSNNALRQLGLEVERANTTSLRLNELHINSIILDEGQVNLDAVALSKK